MPVSPAPPSLPNVPGAVPAPETARDAVRITTQAARFSILTLELAGSEQNVGVLLEDPAHDRMYVRLRRDWDQFAPEEAEVLEALEDGLGADAAELGAGALFERLEDTLSNTLRVSDRRETIVREGSEAEFERALDRLYRQHVPATVQPYVTHLPRYSLAVAAGKFLENQEVTEEAWDEVPGDLKLTPQMFVARIAGRSMEPKIPDGSLCVFRLGRDGSVVTGSRQGKLVLVEARSRGGNDQYTVKRYRSEKKQLPDGTWSHERITLEPLNPEFDAWDLSPDDDSIRILAEFVAVLD